MPTTIQSALRETRDELGSLENTSFIPKNLVEDMSVQPVATVQSKNTILGENNWNEFNWNEAFWNKEVSEPITHYHVKPSENFLLDFRFETVVEPTSNKVHSIGFTDFAETTATVDTDTGNLEIVEGQVWQSHPIYRDATETQLLDRITIESPIADTIADLQLEVGLMTGSGLVWHIINFNEEFVFPAPTWEIRLRLSKVSA